MELFVSFSFLSAFLSVVLAVQLYRIDTRNDFFWFLWVLASAGLWAISNGLWLLVSDNYVLLASNLAYLGIITLPVFMWLFAADYSGSGLFKRSGFVRLLWVVPVLSLLLMLTNRWHGLFWQDEIQVRMFQQNRIEIAVPGLWYWVHSVYSYGIAIWALVMLIVRLKKKKAIVSQYALILAIVLPIATSVLHVLGYTAIDYSPLLLSFTALAFAWFVSNNFFSATIEEMSRLQEQTEQLNRLYALLVRNSEKLIRADTHQTKDAINEVLGDMGRFHGVDRVYVFEYDETKDAVSNTYEWCAEDISKEIHNLQEIPFDYLPQMRQAFENNQHVYIPLVSALPDEPIYAHEKNILGAQNIQSLIVMPMYHGTHFVGFMGFDSVRARRCWDRRTITLLKLMADIVAGSVIHLRYEEALIREKQSAEAASRAKTEFLANMSHELRTPLNAIIGLTDAVASELPHGTPKRQLGMVLDSGLSLLRLLNDLLDFSKAEAGILKLEPAETRLENLLDVIYKTFGPEMVNKDLEWKLNIAEEARRVFLLDAVRMRQILFNIVGNAVKFTHTGFVEVRIEAVAETGDLFTLLIHVIDSGIGIAKEDQALVFESFNQLSKGDSREYEGTGFGLNVASRLMELMGGEILLHSTPGKGSRFTLKIPGVRGL